MAEANVERDRMPFFLSGHSVFDRIVRLRRGMTILMTDETFSEGHAFLKTLFRNRPATVIELVSRHHMKDNIGLVTVSMEALQDLSIQVNQKRRSGKGQVFIHTYLPDLLVRHDPEEVLKLLEIWQKDITNAGTVEFFLLPRNTFTDFEKKAKTIVDAVIDLSIVKSGGQFIYYFMPIRACDPQFHLKNIRYEIAGGKLFIEWEGTLLEELPYALKSVEEVKAEMSNSGDRLVFRVKELNPEQLPITDYLFLTTIDGERVAVVKLLYADLWPDIEEKITNWIVSGVIRLEEAEPMTPMPIRNRLKIKSKLLLKVPLRIAIILVTLSKGFLRGRIRTVPLDAHLAILDAMKKIVDYTSLKRPETRMDARLATYHFGEYSARKTALEYIKRLEGTYYTVFEIKDAPKLIAITLKAGWGLDISIAQVGRNSWVFEIKDCHLCENIRSSSPFCDKFVSSVVKGVLGVCLKRKTECFETSCKAMGSSTCSFKATLL